MAANTTFRLRSILTAVMFYWAQMMSNIRKRFSLKGVAIMVSIFLFSIALFHSVIAFVPTVQESPAQKQAELSGIEYFEQLKQADRFYADKKYSDAVDIYQRLSKSNPVFEIYIPVKKEVLQSLGKLTELKALTLPRGTTDETIRGLSKLKKLERLDFRTMCYIKGDSLEALTKLPSLQDHDFG